MKIGIDIDGVIGSFNDAVIQIVNARTPGRLSTDFEPTSWYWEPELNREEWDWIWADIRKVSNFWFNLKGYEENLRALRNFFETERNHEVYYVTARSVLPGENVPLQTERWLYKNGVHPHNNYQAIIAVTESNQKAAIYHDLGIQFSIDDLGPTVAGLKDIPGHKAYLLDRAYNRDQDYGPRVTSLQQYFDVILGKKRLEDSIQ